METVINNRKIEIFDTVSELAHAGAELFINRAEEAIDIKGYFSVALSGGTTPAPLYALLATSEYRRRLDWQRIHFFWADERCVPPDNQESNFRLANDLLLSKAPIVPAHIHRIRGELHVEQAAAEYEKDLRKFFDTSELPVLDLALLGVGTDGHTASLFPGTPPEPGRHAVSVCARGLSTCRVTLTLPVLNNAHAVLFLVTGTAKAPIIHAILEGALDCPASRVTPADGLVTWFLDREAAVKLSEFKQTSQ